MEHVEPDYLFVPFALQNLLADERGTCIQNMATKVIEELVPNVWREKWAPIGLFLLE